MCANHHAQTALALRDVAVLLAILALLNGSHTLAASGDPRQYLCLRKGSESEIVSNFTRPSPGLKSRGIARRDDNRARSNRNGCEPLGHSMTARHHISVRGTPHRIELRPAIRVVKGRGVQLATRRSCGQAVA